MPLPTSPPSGTTPTAFETWAQAVADSAADQHIYVGAQASLVPFGYKGHVGWNTFSVQSNVPVLLSSGTQNDELTWDISPGAGTYTWRFQTAKGSNRGVATVYIDSVSQGTIDLYAASNAAALVELAGIVVPAGESELKIVMTTAGTGAGFFGLIGAGSLLRTA